MLNFNTTQTYKKVTSTIEETTFLHNGGGSDLEIFIVPSGNSGPTEIDKGIILKTLKDYIIIPANKDIYAKSRNTCSLMYGSDFSFKSGGGNGNGVTESRLSALEALTSGHEIRIGNIETVLPTVKEYLNIGNYPVTTEFTILPFTRSNYSLSDDTKVIIDDDNDQITFVSPDEYQASGSITISNPLNQDRDITIEAYSITQGIALRSGTATIIKNTIETIPISADEYITTLEADEEIVIRVKASNTGLTISAGQISIIK